MSIVATATTWYGAVLSDTGTCFYIVDSVGLAGLPARTVRTVVKCQPPHRLGDARHAATDLLQQVVTLPARESQPSADGLPSRRDTLPVVMTVDSAPDAPARMGGRIAASAAASWARHAPRVA